MTYPHSDKRRLVIMTSALVVLLVTIALWSFKAYRHSTASAGELKMQAIVLILVLVFMLPLLKSAYENIRSGLPMEDERSRRVKVLAGYYAFMVSIYAWLGIMFFEKHFTVSSAAAAAILTAAVTFGVSYAWLNRKPKLD